MEALFNVKISLAAARVNARMSQEEMAEFIGVNTSTIHNWENGKSEPNLTQLRKISIVSKIPIDFIYIPEQS